MFGGTRRREEAEARVKKVKWDFFLAGGGGVFSAARLVGSGAGDERGEEVGVGVGSLLSLVVVGPLFSGEERRRLVTVAAAGLRE